MNQSSAKCYGHGYLSARNNNESKVLLDFYLSQDTKVTFCILRSKMKKTLILSSLFTSFIFTTIIAHATEPTVKTSKITQTKSESIDQVNAQNKKIVIDFYEGVFLKHKVKEYANRYIGQQYIQHNPNVPDGKAPFVNFFTEKFQKNPQAKNEIKRAIAEGDLVVLHVHSTENEKDRGRAIIDIFRLEHGKIVEHWDVIQNIPEQSKNTNTMF